MEDWTCNIASSGPKVPALGLGRMGMSGMYGLADRAESIVDNERQAVFG